VTSFPDRAEVFLDRYPALREAQTRSSVWPLVKEEAAVQVHTGRMYIVGGDTLGGEAALFLDRLARGGRPAAADRLSRELFLELTPDLQSLIRRELLHEPSE
jgi:hypothetical protein